MAGVAVPRGIIRFFLAAMVSLSPLAASAQSDVRAVPTYESAGLYWSAPGADPQTGCTVRYRRHGETAWRAGLDLWFDANANECRGSLVRLSAGTDYDVELGLPGQPPARSFGFTTWANRKPVASTITVPGGSATLDIEQGGSPSGYVVYQAAPGAVLDAANASPFNITVNASYVVVRGFTLRGAGQDAIRLADGVTDVIIEDNDISGWGRQRSGDLGMDMDSAVRAICTSNALERITIQRNRIHDPRYGANSWSSGHPAGPQAITFSHCGGNHVIRHNEIWSSAGHYYNDVIGGEDNISTAGFPNYDSDIYGNKLSNSWDDGIEAEGGDRNVRVWGNYIDSTATGIATALASVGPFYAFRNVYNRNRELDNVPLDSDLRQEIFKTGSDPSFADGRRYFFHNTTLQAVSPDATKTLGVQYGISGAGTDQPFNNAVSRNNIYHTWDDSQPLHRQVGVNNEFTSDMYNGVANVPITNGIHAAPTYAPGNGWQSEDGGQYALQPGTPGSDAGVLIPNFNDDYLGAGPDVGAAEYGQAPMQFGIAASPGSAVAPPPVETNWALASNGGVASASSQLNADYPIGAINDGDTLGASWTHGGGWADGTVSRWPDWVEIDFNGAKAIDKVVVYTVQDNYQNPQPVTDTTTFTQYGITDFDVQGWDGTQWLTLATVRGNNLVKRTVTFSPYTTSRIRISVTGALYYVSRIVEFEAYGQAASSGSGPINMALASNGGVASASSQLNSDYPIAAINDGERAGVNWTHGGGWADGTISQWPDWVQVDFNAPAMLSSVVVYTVQDNYASAVEPTDSMTFSQYGITGFDVQGWDGSQWVTLATVTGNRLVKRAVTFAPFTTTKIRINVTGGLYYVSRITEVEAWGVPSGSTISNVALASNGGFASASSQLNADYPIAAINNGERAGVNWTHGGGWADGTISSWPDWVEIDFNGGKTLSSVVVYTVQDNYSSPIEPTDSTTFSQYGVTDFNVQAWNGSQWVTLATVNGNNLVKRSVVFNPVSTSKIRVNITNALYYVSRITEVEAWGN